METQKRSFAKAISWRLIATLCTGFAGWIITRSVRTGISIGLIDCLIKIGIYYCHERAWQKVNWGIITKNKWNIGEGI